MFPQKSPMKPAKSNQHERKESPSFERKERKLKMPEAKENKIPKSKIRALFSKA